MDNFTKLLLFLGQQYHFYQRKIFFTEELRQIYSSDNEILDALKEPIAQGWIETTIDDHHFQITDLAIVTVLSYWSKDVFQTGEVGGGGIKGNPNNKQFTITVEFDSPIKFSEQIIKKYGGFEIILNCIEGFYYEAKIHTPNEDFEKAEEIINRYLSHLSYHYKIPVSIRATHSGSLDISSNTRRSEARSGIYLQLPNLTDLDEKQSRAIAFYRQFRNFSQIRTTESRYYQLLSLLKIIEGVNPSSNLAKNKDDFIALVERYIKSLTTDLIAIKNGVEGKFLERYGTNTVFSEILWEHYRNGVAHWRAKGNFLDPDIPDNTIASTIRVLEQICIKVIELEYKVI